MHHFWLSIGSTLHCEDIPAGPSPVRSSTRSLWSDATEKRKSPRISDKILSERSSKLLLFLSSDQLVRRGSLRNGREPDPRRLLSSQDAIVSAGGPEIESSVVESLKEVCAEVLRIFSIASCCAFATTLFCAAPTKVSD